MPFPSASRSALLVSLCFALLAPEARADTALPHHQVDLRGEWRVKLAERGDDLSAPLLDDRGWARVTLPGELPAMAKSGLDVDGGHYWFRTKAFIPEHKVGQLGIAIGMPLHAASAYVNGEFIGRSGDPDREVYGPWRPVVFDAGSLTPGAPAIIALHLWVNPAEVAGFPHRSGFGDELFVLGDRIALEDAATARRFGHLVKVALPPALSWIIAIVFGLYYLQFFFRRRERTEYLWFALGCLLVGSSQMIWLVRENGGLDGNLSWDLYRLSRPMFFGGIGCFYRFAAVFLEQPRALKWPARIMLVTLVGSGLLALFPPVFGIAIKIGRVPWVAAGVLLVMVVVSGAVRRVPDALPVVLAVLAFVASAVVFVLEGMFDKTEMPIDANQAGALAVASGVLAMAVSLSARFARVHGEVDRKNAELDKKNAELMRLDQLKDDFLANTSHELRTPLNGIIGLADSLLDGAAGAVNATMANNLSMVVQSGRRLLNLVNDLLDFSKLKHEGIELREKPVHLRGLVDAVLTVSGPLVGDKDLKLVNDVPEDLPAAWADEDRVLQILHNLIGNGVKFTESGAVTVRASVEDERIFVDVVDTGIGIPEDKHDAIFASFGQGDSSTEREYGGTGLGLTVSKQLVELHGGQLTVASTVGEGSTFRFSLPLSDESVDDAASSGERAVTAVAHPIKVELEEAETLEAEVEMRAGGFRVLIVDDEPVNLQVLENHLSLVGFHIERAASGMEALEKIQDGFVPDAIVLDVMMPKMSGYEVTRRIRAGEPTADVPIVLLTAKTQPEDIVQGLSAGANDYVTKPFSKTELVARLKTHLRLSQMNAAARRFVPYEFLEILGKDTLVDIQRGDHAEREMSVLFSDIRGFTTMSEQRTPGENFDFINRYLKRMEPAIHGHNGFVNQFLGDGIMALFHQRADDAVLAAVQMLTNLAAFNEENVALGEPEIKLGIGVNSGRIMLGTIGGLDRIDCGVIADAVNLAARVEGMTKIYGATLLISEGTYDRLEDPSAFTLRDVDRVVAKGKQQPITIYEVLDADLRFREKKKTAVRFDTALSHFRAGELDDALDGFQRVLEVDPEDRAALLYTVRCQRFLAEGVPAGFDGVTRLDRK